MNLFWGFLGHEVDGPTRPILLRWAENLDDTKTLIPSETSSVESPGQSSGIVSIAQVLEFVMGGGDSY